MRLYLVQHGKALSKEENPERPLSPEGIAEVDAVARMLTHHPPEIPEIWHSGKARAQQTAERLSPIVATRGEVVQRDGLAPNDDVKPIADAVATRDADLMIVGHLPFLSHLAARLLAGHEDAAVIAFRNAGVVCLERNEIGAWQVIWIVVPELVMNGED